MDAHLQNHVTAGLRWPSPARTARTSRAPGAGRPECSAEMTDLCGVATASSVENGGAMLGRQRQRAKIGTRSKTKFIDGESSTVQTYYRYN